MAGVLRRQLFPWVAQPMLVAPYTPTNCLDDWRDTYEMLCGFCAHEINCPIVDGMIEMKDGGSWPDGGWVYAALCIKRTSRRAGE